jgi:hypothetical protein
MNGSDGEPETWINALAALALVIAAPANPGTVALGDCASARKASPTSTAVEAGSSLSAARTAQRGRS